MRNGKYSLCKHSACLNTNSKDRQLSPLFKFIVCKLRHELRNGHFSSFDKNWERILSPLKEHGTNMTPIWTLVSNLFGSWVDTTATRNCFNYAGFRIIHVAENKSTKMTIKLSCKKRNLSLAEMRLERMIFFLISTSQSGKAFLLRRSQTRRTYWHKSKLEMK